MLAHYGGVLGAPGPCHSSPAMVLVLEATCKEPGEETGSWWSTWRRQEQHTAVWSMS